MSQMMWSSWLTNTWRYVYRTLSHIRYVNIIIPLTYTNIQESMRKLYFFVLQVTMLVVQTILFMFAIHTLTGQYTERCSWPEAAPNRDGSDSQQHHTPPDSEPEDPRGSVLPWSCVQCWGSVHCCMWDPWLPGCPLGGIVLARAAQVPPPVDAIHWGWISHMHHGLYNTGVAVGVAVAW